MTAPGGRRPLRSRGWTWSRTAAAWLTARGLRPNHISLLALLAALLGLCCLLAVPHAPPPLGPVLLVATVATIQLRLACNLLDGMVAVEGGLAEPDGAFWNEVPDRFSDMAFFVGAGIAADTAALGWAVAALAILTAYLRDFGRAEGLAADYGGPMAKQHRMAALSAGCLAAAVWPAPAPVLAATLWLIAAGTAATALRRSLRLIRGLRAR